ncbi:MAG TPA: serine hydrolase [Actinomycetota bacterium]|nr:serine hydrolase [Actinomycetota bacterium]
MELPNTPAGAVARWAMSNFGADLSVDELQERFAQAFLEMIPPDEIRAFFRKLGTLVPADVESVSGLGTHLTVALGTERGPFTLQVVVAPEEPHLIIGLLVRPAGPAVAKLLRSNEPMSSQDAIEHSLVPWSTSLRGDGAGAVCAVQSAGKTVMRSFGAVATNSVFEIGSITKPVTATLLAIMAARQDLLLEDPIAKYLPSGSAMPPGGEDITFAELATHSSGLPRLPSNLKVKDRSDPYATFTITALFDGLAETPISNRGSVAYSNVGYALLGQILARAANKSFEELLNEQVLEPFDMTDARIGPDHRLGARRVPGHRGGERVPHWTRTAVAPAGGIEASATDVLAFLNAHIKAPPDSGLRATHDRRHEFNDGFIGLAWMIVPTDHGDVLWHNGGTGGFRSFAGFHAASSTAVVALSNAGDGNDLTAAAAAVLGSVVAADHG